MAARFGDMLLDRRRQMGLSIQQVANTIKIRPQIIEFFEQGNFASMPPRGYAQGMISSYARFLGLNPRDVVNAYFDDLMAYERETSQRGGRFQDAAGYVNARSSTDNGRFLMVEGGRSTRYGQRPPQAGYVTENGSGADIREQRDRFRNTLPPADSALPASRGNIRNPRAGYGDGGYANRSPRDRGYSRDAMRSVDASRRYSDNPRGGYRDGSDSSSRSPRSRGGVSSRSSYDHGRVPYRDGRSGQNPRRPMPDPHRGSRSGRSSSQAAPQTPLNDPRFVYGALAVILCLLIAVILLLFRGCTPAKQQETKPSATTSSVASGSTASSKKSSKRDSSSDDSEDSDDSESSSDDSASKSKKNKVTKVKVKVAKGKTAWIEVKVDGKSVYGAQATGPFEQEYTPESSIEITTSKPSDVTVTKNGEKVRYDTKTSGVARVTITVPKKATTGKSSSSDSDSSDTSDGSDSSDSSSTDSSDTQSSDSGDTSGGTDDSSTTDVDATQDYSSSTSYQTYSTQ